MIRTSLIRIASAALALTALSFAAGVAGDLASEKNAPNSGVRVVLRIPPPSPMSASPASASESSLEDAVAPLEDGESA